MGFTSSSLGASLITNNNINAGVTLNHQSGSLSFSNNQILGGLISTQQSTPGKAFAFISNNLVLNSTTLNHNSSSITATNNLIGGISITNDVSTSFSTGNNGIGVNRNIIQGTGNLIYTTGSMSTSTPRFFTDNLIVGRTNTVSSSYISNNNSNLLATAVVGQNLVVSASHNTSNGGSAFFGRFNDTGSLATSQEIVFAVGTGTGTSNRRTGFWIDSGSVSNISGSLNISGSIYGTNIPSGSTSNEYIVYNTGSGQFERTTGTAGIFAQTGSFWNTTRNVGITGSLVISGSNAGLGITSANHLINGNLGLLDSVLIFSQSLGLTDAYQISLTAPFGTQGLMIRNKNVIIGREGSNDWIENSNNNSNLALGRFAAQSFQSGNENLFINVGGSTFKSGSANVFIHNSLGALESGSNNTIIGFYQRGNTTENNLMSLGSNVQTYVVGAGNNVQLWKDTFVTGTFQVSGNTSVTGSLIVSTGATITGSLVASGSAHTLIGPSTITGSLVVSGSALITGSVQGNVNALTISSNTASLDLNDGNFFTLQLVSGSATHINPSNIKPGQTINILLSTTGSGTVNFPSSVKQVSGSVYVPTTGTSVDVITMVSFDASSLYLANVKNLI